MGTRKYNFLRIICVIAIVFPALLSVSQPAVAQQDGLELLYTVTIENEKPTFHISIEISNLNPGEFILDFQDGRVINHEQYITNVQARTKTQNLNIIHVKENVWRVYQSEGELFVDYDISKLMPFQVLQSRDLGQKNIAVYLDNAGGMFFGQYVFLKPSYLMASAKNIKDIKIKFSLPVGWQLITPFVERDGYFDVPKITNYYLSDFVNRTIYFGNMRFYTENHGGSSIIKFGILENDQSNPIVYSDFLTTEGGVQFYSDRVALAIDALAKMFGENPYPVVPVVDSFVFDGELLYQPWVVGEVQYWSPGRYDETIGHLFYMWMREIWFAPSATNLLIGSGIGESYYGNKLAYQITGDKRYLGKIYHYYLVYKAAQGTPYSLRDEIHDKYYRGCVIGLWLDNMIQKETGGDKSLDDVMGYLYNKYKNTEHVINNSDLEAAVDLITNKDHSSDYSKYLDGNQDIPVEEYIQPYKDGFSEFLTGLNSNNWTKDYHNHSIPFFVDVEMSIRSPLDLPMGILIDTNYLKFAKYIFENYDIDDLTKEDVEKALTKLTGQDSTGFFERWKDSYGELSLDELKDWLRSYLPYAPQNLESVYKYNSANRENSVAIRWDQVEWRYPSYYYEITGYAVYRGTSPGEEVLIATVDASTTTYTDTYVRSGETYYYYVKSVENLFQEIEVYSQPSGEATVVCKDTTPPIIEVSVPENVNESEIIISGKVTDATSGVKDSLVLINNELVDLNVVHYFSYALKLNKGENVVTISAEDNSGNQAEKSFIIYFIEPTPTPTIQPTPTNPFLSPNPPTLNILFVLVILAVGVCFLARYATKRRSSSSPPPTKHGSSKKKKTRE